MPVPVALFPALGAGTESLRPLAAALAELGLPCQVVGRGPQPDLRGHVEEARAVLARSALTDVAPGARWILVGASYGGMVARCLAALDPVSIAGLVLLDSPHEASHPVISALAGERAEVELPNPEAVDLRRSLSYLGDTCPPGALADVPLVVISRDAGRWPGVDPALPAADRVWLSHQRLLSLLSRRSRHLLLSGVGHDVAEEAPEAVARVVAALAADVDDRDRAGAAANLGISDHLLG